MPNPVHKRRLARIYKNAKPKIEENVVEELVADDETEDIVVESGTITEVIVDDDNTENFEPEPEIEDETTYTKEELEKMLKSELVELAEELELDTTGTKSDLVELILEKQ